MPVRHARRSEVVAGDIVSPFAWIGLRPRPWTSQRAWHPARNIKTLVHGDDYVSSGDLADMKLLESQLMEAYEIKTQLLGVGKDCRPEGKVLNRVLRRIDQEWEIKADARHAEFIIEQPDIGCEKGVSSLGISAAKKRTWIPMRLCPGRWLPGTDQDVSVVIIYTC